MNISTPKYRPTSPLPLTNTHHIKCTTYNMPTHITNNISLNPNMTLPIGPRACYDEGKRVAETMMYAYESQADVEVNTFTSTKYICLQLYA